MKFCFGIRGQFVLRCRVYVMHLQMFLSEKVSEYFFIIFMDRIPHYSVIWCTLMLSQFMCSRNSLFLDMSLYICITRAKSAQYFFSNFLKTSQVSEVRPVCPKIAAINHTHVIKENTWLSEVWNNCPKLGKLFLTSDTWKRKKKNAWV